MRPSVTSIRSITSRSTWRRGGGSGKDAPGRRRGRGTYEVLGKLLADDDAEDLDVLGVGRQGVVGHHPLLGAQKRLDPGLFDVRVLLLEFLRELERDDGESRDVIL